eukprot:5389478-Amphidinium_carterae.1
MQNDMALSMADVQFGHLSNGCAQFATYVDGCRRCHPDLALLQLDMANAFGTVRRSYVVDLLRAHRRHTRAAPWVPWVLEYLSTPQHIPPPHIGRILPDTRVQLYTTWDGIPQGDPLSAFLFSYVFAHLLRTMPVSLPVVGAYVDDGVLGATLEVLGSSLPAISAHLAWGGLQIQPTKSKLWMPAGPDSPPECTAELSNVQQLDGFLLCGQALGR